MREIPTFEAINGANETFRKAAEDGDFEAVKHLSGNPDIEQITKILALQSAARIGHVEMAKFLLEDKDTALINIHSAMKVAVDNDHVEIVKLLLTHPSIDKGSVSEAIRSVMRMRNPSSEMTQLLLADKRVNMDDEIRNAHKNKESLVKKMLYKASLSPNSLALRLGIERNPSHYLENNLSAAKAFAKTVSYHPGIFLFYNADKLSKDTSNMNNIPKDVLGLITKKGIDIMSQDENKPESGSQNKP